MPLLPFRNGVPGVLLLLLLCLLVTAVPTAVVHAANIDLTNGYKGDEETYGEATYFQLKGLVASPAVSSTATFNKCTITNTVYLAGFTNVPEEYNTSPYISWKDTTLKGNGAGLCVRDLWPDSYIIFSKITGTDLKLAALTLDSDTYDLNMTLHVLQSDLTYQASDECAVKIASTVANKQRAFMGHTTVYIRDMKVTKARGLLDAKLNKDTVSLEISEDSQFYMESCTCVGCKQEAIQMTASSFSVADHSALIFNKITTTNPETAGRTFFSLSSGYITVDETSVFSLIDIDHATGFDGRLFDRLSVKGAGSVVFSRIKMTTSGLDTPQPEDNERFWATAETAAGAKISQADLKSTYNFNMNDKNKMEWDGTQTGSSSVCAPVGLAIVWRAEYKVVSGKCAAKCTKDYREPACVASPPPPKECLVDHCELCFRCSKNKCLLCDAPRQPEATSSETCDCRIDKCVDCPKVGVCATCEDEYKLTVNDKACFHCTIPKCKACRADGVCDVCDTDHKPSEERDKCSKCTMKNCDHCFADGVCSKCSADYLPTNGGKDCFKCKMDKCNECSADNVCKDCLPGYKPSKLDGKCYKCTMDNCDYCSLDDVCDKCIADYKPNKGGEKCFKCTMDKCNSCSADNTCTDCTAGNKPSETDGKCYQCIDGCDHCSSDGVCTKCTDDYKPGNNGKECFKCTMDKCNECSADNVCKECEAGSKPSELDGKCYQCTMDKCVSCSGDNQCMTCDGDYKPSADKSECFKCAMNNCQTCSEDNQCATCGEGFKPSPGKDNCYQCTVDKCLSCGTNNDCQDCEKGFTLTKGNVCVQCEVDGCGRCEVAGVCAVCEDSDATVTEDGVCISCNIGNCTFCSSAGHCGMCRCGQVPTDDGKKCVECTVSNCRHCDLPGDGKKCAECADGYDVNSDGKCSKSGIPSWVVFIIVVVVTVVIAVSAALAIFFIRRYRAEQRQMAIDAEERRKNRTVNGRRSRQRTEMAMLDLGDIENAASGVRDTTLNKHNYI